MTQGESERESDDRKVVEAPDGGWGWVVCFATFMINFTAVGVATSTGIIVLGLIEIYDCPLSKTSLIGSLYSGMPMFVGPLVLFLMMNNMSHRQVIILGGFIAFLSTIGSVFARQIEVIYLTHGILSSFFTGVSYFAGTTILGIYFKKKRTLAVGLASSGTGAGAFALNNLIEQSISFYGMRGTFLLISGLILNICVYGALCRPLKTVKNKNNNTSVETVQSGNALQPETNLGFESDEQTPNNNEETNTTKSDDVENPGTSEKIPPRKMSQKIASKCKHLSLSLFDPTILKNIGMRWLLVIYLFWAVNETVLFYLPSKVVNSGLTREQGAWVMSTYGAVFAGSQIAVGIIADVLHIPKCQLLMFSMFGSSISCILLTYCHNFTYFCLCASLFAICNGFSNSLRVVLVACALGIEKLNKGYSTLCFLSGITCILSPLIAGALNDATGSIDTIFYYCAANLIISFICSSGIVYMKFKGKFIE